jgi:predicted kinase
MKVVILRGLSGSGKSYYIRHNLPDAYVCSADFFFMREGEYHFNPSFLPHAHAACMGSFIEALREERPLVAVDNTNVTLIEIAPYISVAQAFGYQVEIVCVDALKKFSVKDLSERNVHGVPYQAICSMESRWENNFPPFWPRQKFV